MKKFTSDYLIQQVDWLRGWSLKLAGVYLLLSMLLDYFRFPSSALAEIYYSRIPYMVLPILVVTILFIYQKKLKLSRTLMEVFVWIGGILVGFGHSDILAIAAKHNTFFPKIGITIILIYVGLLLALRLRYAISGSLILIVYTCYIYTKIGVESQLIASYFFFYFIFASCCILTNIVCIKILKANMLLMEKTNILAITDELTELYNRRYFYKKSEFALGNSYKEQQSLSLILIDLDNFKVVNDTLGHGYGDRVLSRVAKTLRSQCKTSTGLAFRIGGDEFTILTYGLDTRDNIKICKNIIKEISEITAKIKLKDSSIEFGVSIGVAENATIQTQNIDDLMEAADKSLYQVKSQGKNNFAISDPS